LLASDYDYGLVKIESFVGLQRKRCSRHTLASKTNAKEKISDKKQDQSYINQTKMNRPSVKIRLT